MIYGQRNLTNNQRMLHFGCAVNEIDFEQNHDKRMFMMPMSKILHPPQGSPVRASFPQDDMLLNDLTFIFVQMKTELGPEKVMDYTRRYIQPLADIDPRLSDTIVTALKKAKMG